MVGLHESENFSVDIFQCIAGVSNFLHFVILDDENSMKSFLKVLANINWKRVRIENLMWFCKMRGERAFIELMTFCFIFRIVT